MAKETVLLVFLFIFFLTLADSQITHHNKIFLASHESYLFFPHRHFQFVSTYTSTCSAKPTQLVIQHQAMATVAQFPFNNTNLGINILSYNQATSTVFYYAKINVNGICSIYQVDQQEINILYQYNFAGEFTHVVLLDKFHAFLWNCESFVQLEYSVFDKRVTVRRGRFEKENARSCQKYKEGTMLCWGQREISFIILEESSFRVEGYEWNEDQVIHIMLPLDKTEDVFFICSFTQCNITQLLPDRSLNVIDNFPFVWQILGGDFNAQTNQIVIIHPATAIIFTYNPRLYSIQIQESLDFYSDLECVFIENVRFLNEQILVNCNNFMGEAQHLALIKDKELNRFFSYQPLRSSEANNPCLFDGNQKYIFAVCKYEIITMMNNFAYFQINETADGQTINIECLDVDEDVIKIPQKFQLLVVAAEYGLAYVNEPILGNKTINFDDIMTLKLRDKFTASAIDHYTVESPDCPYLKQIIYNNIDPQYFVSLYVKEKCVQIAAADNRNFYRVLQMNETIYYLQLCTMVKIGFACELYQIIDNVISLRLLSFRNRIFKLYIQESNLIIQEGAYADVIFTDVTYYEIRDQIIRVRSKNMFFSNSISNVVNNCGAWIEEEANSTYFHSKQDIFKVDLNGKITQYRKNEKKLLTFNLPIVLLGKNHTFTLPFFLSKGYYLFVINETHITKLYDKETSIVIYELPYNDRGLQIESVRSVDNYIVIQYVIGYFQIYDSQRESVAALIAVQQEEVLCDIILMDKDVILVPLRNQNYLLRIQTDPSLVFRPLPPFYNRFNQLCSFTISPHLSNGSCPELPQQSVSQTITLNIRFNIQKIELKTQTLVLSQPRQCSNCIFQISEQPFQGPIFTYEFNDDDYGTFQLVSHLNMNDCESTEEQHLLRMVQVHTADECTRNELLMMNTTHILLLDQNLNQIYNASLQPNNLCVSYTLVETEYLLLCQHTFLLFSKTSQLTSIPHNLSINSSPSIQYEVKSEFAREGIYYLYIKEELIMQIAIICTHSRAIQYISVQELTAQVLDFAVVKDNIITLGDGRICVSKNEVWKGDCFELDSIIPNSYAHDYEYEEFLTYYVTESCLRTLLISKTNQNLHIDLQINLEERPIKFTLLNLYAGYIGYSLRGIISINTLSDGSYTNFILHYEDPKDPSGSSFIAYYQYNDRYQCNGIIGQIRSALFLYSYFQSASKFSFLSFPHRLYITNLSHPTFTEKKYKKCLSVRVEDKLQVISNYKQPSLLKFLILKTKNINDLQTYYIKVNYDPQGGLITHTSIGLVSTIIFFVILAIGTNRCKDGGSELTIHFMSEQIQKEFSEDAAQSDLLHSQTSGISSSSPTLSPTHSNEQID